MSAVGKVLAQGEIGFSRSMGGSSLDGMRRFPEEVMAIEFKLGNEHDQICKTY